MFLGVSDIMGLVRIGPVITSRSNPLIRDLRAVLRSPGRGAARLIVEGWRLLGAAAEAGVPIEIVLYTPAAAADPRWASLRQQFPASGAREALVSPEVLAALSQVETAQGVLGVVARPATASPSILRTPDALLVVLDGIQDPGNVGAILRTAAAAGATAAVTVAPAADPFTPKALRASAGAVWRLPLLHFGAASDAAAAVMRPGLRLFVADPRGEKLHSQVSFARPVALVFGSEGAGADPAWLRAGAETVRLPIVGPVESLNVAAAAAVLLYGAAGLFAPSP